MATVSVLQMNSAATWADNKASIEALFAQLPTTRPQLVLLPEAFSCFGAGEANIRKHAEPFGRGPVQSYLAALAKQHNVWLLAGTLPIQSGARYAAASLLFNAQGEQCARYDKLHLFDAAVADQTKHYRESEYTQPGTQVSVVDTPFGRLGMAICYDVRFPELFRQLRAEGADFISLPSAFTKVTGKAHWNVLVRARAIENQVYMLAPNQWGEHADGRETWGHSLIVDPWGVVVAEQSTGVGIASATLDMKALEAVRANMPVSAHNRFEVRFLNE